MYLLIYVDDMFIATKNMSEINKLKAQLSSEFEMKDLRATKKILVIEIRRDRKTGKLYLSQKNYFEKVLKHFGRRDSKLVSTPLASHFKLSADLSPQIKYMSHVPYTSAVGSLICSIVCTRSNISHVVSVCRYMECPEKAHCQAVKLILRYLKGTVDVGLMFDKTGGLNGCAIGFVNFDYTGDHDKRRSLTDYVFTFASYAVS